MASEKIKKTSESESLRGASKNTGKPNLKGQKEAWELLSRGLRGKESGSFEKFNFDAGFHEREKEWNDSKLKAHGSYPEFDMAVVKKELQKNIDEFWELLREKDGWKKLAEQLKSEKNSKFIVEIARYAKINSGEPNFQQTVAECAMGALEERHNTDEFLLISETLGLKKDVIKIILKGAMAAEKSRIELRDYLGTKESGYKGSPPRGASHKLIEINNLMEKFK